jgi:transglutaminase-like putative cysteine protease
MTSTLMSDTPSTTPTHQIRTAPLWAHLVLPGSAAIAALAALMAVGTVVSGRGWMLDVIGFMVVTFIACDITRRIAPFAFVPVAGAAALVIALVGTYAPTDARWGWLPTTSALGELLEVLRSGALVIENSEPPAAPVAELVALLSLSMGLVTLVLFVLVVMLRSPLLGGGILLASHAIPLTVIEDGAPLRAFLALGMAFAVLLIVDQSLRVGGWGHAIGPTAEAGSGRIRAAGALRLTVAGLGVALVLPLLIPGLDEPVWRPGAAGSGPGFGSSSDRGTSSGLLLDTEVSLRRNLTRGEDVEVLRYRTNDPTPSYIRLAALTRFDGVAWRRPVLSQGSASGTSAVDLLQFDPVPEVRTYTIQVSDLDNRLLPVPFPPRSISGTRGAWDYDPGTLTIWSPDQRASGQRYEVQAFNVEPSAATLSEITDEDIAANLPAVPRPDSLNVPSDLPQVVIDTAERVTRGASTPYERAAALQGFFRTSFAYSLDVTSDPDEPPFESFLAERVGYCEQFAATMAIMARIVGIPARVAVGFTTGRATANGEFVVTSWNAHAWPELWFPGHGWVRFEPTPRAEPGSGVRLPAWAPMTVDPSAGLPYLPRSERSDQGAAGTGNLGGLDPLNDPAVGAAPITPAVDDPDATRRILLAALFALGFIGILTPAMIRAIRRWQRRRLMRERDPGNADIDAAWDELRDVVIDVGGTWSPAHTPRQAGVALLDRVRGHESSRAVATLVSQTEERRFAAPQSMNGGHLHAATSTTSTGSAKGRGLEESVRAITMAMHSQRSRKLRLRSALLPASVLQAKGSNRRSELTED